ncbi:MAG: hypothetical protein GWP63_21925 [Haliea sp.]|jgi:hypothetical protein|nr:hypothetical protein [Haliea sp.]
MEVSPFNTLEWAERLERAGYDREQARALVRVCARTFVFTEGQLVTLVEPEQVEAAEMALELIEKAVQ